ncbi:MAG: hypothetical protein QOG34_1366, partial [Frankiaceae bacterium]|nr:hypothetical protein [Frankiaceae bacterium]
MPITIGRMARATAYGDARFPASAALRMFDAPAGRRNSRPSSTRACQFSEQVVMISNAGSQHFLITGHP